eukprot:TRINITY_DN73700_c0_g1_i1.p1 TRINITY_DN73700_c0_g1~~TRINITY_DN73700_c0_g1_i1.p1  ORF type:complete len:244 (+),score=16.79 TRINITY_DN73700_c0_g1_i1:161-892(+)
MDIVEGDPDDVFGPLLHDGYLPSSDDDEPCASSVESNMPSEQSGTLRSDEGAPVRTGGSHYDMDGVFNTSTGDAIFGFGEYALSDAMSASGLIEPLGLPLYLLAERGGVAQLLGSSSCQYISATGSQATRLSTSLIWDEENSLTIPSIGSEHHFVGQCTPCKYAFGKRGCRFGLECRFCHFPHDERTRSSVKRNRRMKGALRHHLGAEALGAQAVQEQPQGSYGHGHVGPRYWSYSSFLCDYE